VSKRGAPVRVRYSTAPREVVETISQHLAELSSSALDLLTTAAILGSSFDVGKLGVVSGLTSGELVAQLDEGGAAVPETSVTASKGGELPFGSTARRANLRP
jgi:hypothetical protein